MCAGSPLVEEIYTFTRRLFEVTATFSAGEKALLGRQVREAAIHLATQATDAITTDDPAERQEMLRMAGIACIRMSLLLRIAGDLGELQAAELQDMMRRVKSLDAGIARERRSVRR